MLVSQLEHHSNIVPWQLAGYEVDAVPLTPDGQIDLDAAEAMLTRRASRRRVRARIERARLDPRREARGRDRAHSKGALLLLDGCQAVPRLPVDVADIGADFYAFSAHKLYGPTGIGCLWGRSELLASMPPWQGGGSMIDKVTFEATSFLDPPARFEAGTPHIVGAIGLHAAVNWVEDLGLDAIHAHECALVAQAREALAQHPGRDALRPRGQRRNRQLQRRRGASARHRHHIGRCGRRGPRRPSLRAAADALARRRGDCARELCGA